MDKTCTGLTGGTLDLRSMNVALWQECPELNGFIWLKWGFKGGYQGIKVPQNLQGAILCMLIISKCGSLGRFAKAIGKTKGWVKVLLDFPKKAKLTLEVRGRISEALGIEVLL
ncbi:MAG: hypothetical protein WCI72_03415 [archaeon]